MAQEQVAADPDFRFRFELNDRVLCYHGNILYEARCLNRFKMDDNKVKYLLHYVGWNRRWDEWIDDDQIVALNCVSMKKMASLRAMHSDSKAKAKAKQKRPAKPYSSSGGLRKKKNQQQGATPVVDQQAA